jgi:hypothetical protein
MDFSKVSSTQQGIITQFEQPLAQNDFLRMHKMLLGSDQLRACIREVLNSTISDINNLDAVEDMIRDIYIDEAIKRCHKDELYLGTSTDKRTMSPNEKILFTTLFPWLVIAALKFHNEGHVNALWVAGDTQKGEAFFVGRNNEGEFILMHQASVKDSKEVMSLAKITNAPEQLQQKIDLSQHSFPQNQSPELIRELQQRIDPNSNLVNQQTAQQSLSQQYPQFQNQQLQNLQPQYSEQPRKLSQSNGVGQQFYPSQSAIQQPTYPQQQIQPSPNSNQNEVERRFETRREMFLQSEPFRIHMCSELKTFLDSLYNIGINQGAKVGSGQNLNPLETTAYQSLSTRVFQAVRQFYEQGNQNPVFVMGDERPETHFFVKVDGDGLVLTNRNTILMVLEGKLRNPLQVQQPMQQFNPQQQAYPQPQQVVYPNQQQYGQDLFLRQRSDSSPQYQPSVIPQPQRKQSQSVPMQQQYYPQQPVPNQQNLNQSQIPPTGYPPNHPTGY